MPPQSRKKQTGSSKPAVTQAVSTQPPSDSSQAGIVADPGQQLDAKQQSLAHILLVLPILLTVASSSIAAWAYTRALDPLYGTVPTSLNLNTVIWAVTLIAWFAPGPSGWTSAGILGTALCALPNSAYWAAVYTGSTLQDPRTGPIATHIVALGPVVYFAAATVRKMIDFFGNHSDEQTSIRLRYTILPSCATSVLGFAPVWNDFIPKLLQIPSVSQFVSSEEQLIVRLGVAVISVWAISVLINTIKPATSGASSSTSTWRALVPIIVLGALPAIIPHLASPVLSHSPSIPYFEAGSPVRILSSVQSVSGRIVVGESVAPQDTELSSDFPTGLRYLRASHSLLGGVWIGSKAISSDGSKPLLADTAGEPLGDSIYNTFIIQEAVRLINKKERAIPESGEKALIIGLGAGISATALSRHDITTTIIEIDPAVYNASVKFFGLPEPPAERLFISDARRVVYEKAKQIRAGGEGDLYDYVIHDLFSGGSVPGHLFTVEFWQDLKAIMNPDGVVAVNYAGVVGKEASRSILLTLQASFGQCRVFHDSLQPEAEQEFEGDFVNLVFFCSPSAKLLDFRSATKADYLGSYLRANVLSNFSTVREIRKEAATGDISGQEYEKWVLKDAANKLDEWQKPSALTHWKIMRSVLPDIFWSTY